MVPHLGRILILSGAMLVVTGIALVFFDKIPYLGKLPGDLHIKRENLELHIPIVSSLLLSLLVSGILWLLSAIGRK